MGEMIPTLTERQVTAMSAAKKFCAALEQEFGRVYVDPEGNHYVEIDGRWMQWKFIELLDKRP